MKPVPNSANDPCRELAIQHLTQLRLISRTSLSSLRFTRLLTSNGAWCARLVSFGVLMFFSVACDDTGVQLGVGHVFSLWDEAIARYLPCEAYYEPIKYVYIRNKLEYDSHDTLFQFYVFQVSEGT